MMNSLCPSAARVWDLILFHIKAFTTAGIVFLDKKRHEQVGGTTKAVADRLRTLMGKHNNPR